MCVEDPCVRAQSCLMLCDSKDCSPPGPSVPGILQARMLERVAIPFLQGLFRTQVWNPGLLQCRQILHHLSHQGSPMVDFNLLFFSHIYFSYLFIWPSQVLVASHRAFHCGTQTLAGACGLMWDLRSPTRDCIPVPYIAR